MGEREQKVIVTVMKPRSRSDWAPKEKEKKKIQLSKRIIVCAAAAVFCLSAGALLLRDTPQTQSVMSHLETGFEYDESIGRLQFVSNILPESAMVFLSSTSEDVELTKPTDAQEIHVWSQSEPWIEYDAGSQVVSCRDGEVMTVVKNRVDEYTVRILHDDGYESVYSGLTEVFLQESDPVFAGESIGYAQGEAAFELRKDGLSILPDFSVQ